MDALEKAVEVVGGVGQLAGLLGVVQGAVSNWKARKRVPAEYCPRIERLTSGAVRCEDLRPDVDWAYLREAARPTPTSPQLSEAT